MISAWGLIGVFYKNKISKSCTFFVIMETLSVGNFISKLYNCHKELKGDKR